MNTSNIALIISDGKAEKLSRPSRPLFTYGFALAVSVLAGLLTQWLRPYIGNNFSELFQAAVVLSAWYGGLGPGISSAAASFLIFDYFFTPPLNFFTGHKNLLSLVIFAGVAVLTGSLSGKLKRAKSDLEMAYDDLEDRIRQRTRELSQSNASLVKEMSQRLEAENSIIEITNREQRRLGLDLHDGLCQILAGTKLLTESVKRKVTEGAAVDAADVDLIENRLSQALAQADNISRGLYPVSLETNGLMSALEELAVKTTRMYPVRCRFLCRAPVETPDASLATHLYRIAQEAVINAIKSGKAGRVNIRLASRVDKAVLTVADNGLGFNGKPLRQGMGLKIMKYRADVIGGVLTFRSRPRGGTLVSCSFHLKRGE